MAPTFARTNTDSPNTQWPRVTKNRPAVAATPSARNAARKAFLLPLKSAIAPRNGPARPTRTTASDVAKAKRALAISGARSAAGTRVKYSGKTISTVVMNAEFATS